MTTKYHQHAPTLPRIQKIMMYWLSYEEKVLKSFSHWGALVLYFSTKQLCSWHCIIKSFHWDIEIIYLNYWPLECAYSCQKVENIDQQLGRMRIFLTLCNEIISPALQHPAHHLLPPSQPPSTINHQPVQIATSNMFQFFVLTYLYQNMQY